MLGLLRRTFVTHSTIVKKKLYLSLIRSQLTYCSQIWQPFLRKDILFIEKIQRRATKYILNDYNSSYKSRLIQLKLLPLMYLFDFNDLIFFIKSYKSPSHHFDINAKQKHLGCKKGEANQKQQLSDYKSIHSYTCD